MRTVTILILTSFLTIQISFADRCPPQKVLQTILAPRSTDAARIIELAKKHRISNHVIENGSLLKQVEEMKARFPAIHYEDFLSEEVQVRKNALIRLYSAIYDDFVQGLSQVHRAEDLAILNRYRSLVAGDLDRLPSYGLSDEGKEHLLKALQGDVKEGFKAPVASQKDRAKVCFHDGESLIEFYQSSQYHSPSVIDAKLSGYLLHLGDDRIYLPWFSELSIHDLAFHSSGADFLPVGILKGKEVAMADGQALHALDFFTHDLAHAKSLVESGLEKYQVQIKAMQERLLQSWNSRSVGQNDALDRVVFYALHEKGLDFRNLIEGKMLPAQWTERVKGNILHRSVEGDMGEPLVKETFEADVLEAIQLVQKEMALK
jgi:hypothetical protein